MPSRLTSSVTATCDLPVDQAQGVDVRVLEGVKELHVDGLIQHLWSHVSEGEEGEGFGHFSFPFWGNTTITELFLDSPTVSSTAKTKGCVDVPFSGCTSYIQNFSKQAVGGLAK